jgi:hypothetical protein
MILLKMDGECGRPEDVVISLDWLLFTSSFIEVKFRIIKLCRNDRGQVK